jgi:hypothetical protein
VWMVYPRQEFLAFFQREVLWSRRLRSIRPRAHFGLIFTYALFGAAIAALVSADVKIAAMILAAYGLMRAAVVLTVGLGALRDRLVLRTLPLIPVWDAIAIAVWFSSFRSRRGSWRGREYSLEANGRLALVPASSNTPALSNGLLGNQELSARRTGALANVLQRSAMPSQETSA